MSNKKYKSTVIAASVCWLGLQGNLAMAADQATDNDQLVKKLVKRTQVLESQLHNLQGQVTSLKKSKLSKSGTQTSSADYNVIANPKQPIFVIGTPVMSSPFIGINSEYNASDLVINQPYVNEDLYLLQQRKQVWNYLHREHNYPISSTPILNLSGKIESQITHGSDGTDVNLTEIELDTEILVNKWVTGLIAFAYDKDATGTPRRIDNSRAFLKRGFITVGNLAEFPVYGTIGQFYVPFGQYASDMISDPFTKTLGRTKARALTLGFSKQFDSKNNLNLAAFVFRGPSKTSSDNNGLHNYGANIDYTYTDTKWNLNLAASYIRSIADSVGMQNNGNSEENGFKGFATRNETEILDPVPAIDARGTLGVGPVSLSAEYVTATKAFSASDLSYNQQGAKPQAFHTEAAYKFTAWDKPSAFIVGYDYSKDALALMLPKKRYIATASTSIWKSTTESIEFRHDIEYGASDVANGGGLIDSPIKGKGGSSNTVTFQFGIYF